MEDALHTNGKMASNRFHRFIEYYIKGVIPYFSTFSNSGRVLIRFFLNRHLPPPPMYLRNKFSYGRKIGFFVDKFPSGGGHFSAVFYRNEYGPLDVAGKTVIDVGASIGDTAIYFLIKGAKRVIAIEPNILAIHYLQRNINLNRFDDKITVVNAAVGREHSTMIIDPSSPPETGYKPNVAAVGVEISVIPLADIIESLGHDVVLKLDCEGCEFEALESIPSSILSNVDEIFLEFHRNPITIANRLEAAGFGVEYDRTSNMGYLHARNVYASRAKHLDSMTNQH